MAAVVGSTFDENAGTPATPFAGGFPGLGSTQPTAVATRPSSRATRTAVRRRRRIGPGSSASNRPASRGAIRWRSMVDEQPAGAPAEPSQVVLEVLEGVVPFTL